VDSDRSAQIRTGFFTLAVLAAGAVIVLMLTQEGGLFTPRYGLYADFDDIQGLTVNAPVWLAGNNVGRVSSILFREPGADKAIRVELQLDAAVAERIREDSLGMIGTIGLLGDKFVEITLGTQAAAALPPGAVLSTEESPTLSEFAAKGEELLENLVGLSGSAERIVGSFEQEMAGESLASTLGGVQRIVQEIERGDGLLHALVYDEAGPETLGEVRGSLEELRASLGHIRALLREVEQGEGALHELIYVEPGETPALQTLLDSIHRLDSILRKIDEGDGTLGALINDPSLYEEVRLLVGGARQSALLRRLIDFVRPEQP
jgi:phospholipid/cholesterol/gamma-HCH transport system substrate-binding protein